MKGFNHEEIEKKWREIWERDGLYTVPDKPTEKNAKKENFYTLVEFPYPSGSLHVGHWYAFAVPDMFARYKRMSGYNTLFPIGFDAFGLPAENAAIKRGINPRVWTFDNIEHMRKQLRSMGCMFDWSREVITADPSYYKWTQWLFLKLYEAGLVYQAETLVNWCPSCKTVLANEQVIAGRCERCDTEVEQKTMKQWMIRITKYADRLLEDLEDLPWPEEIKASQRNWIGRNTGARFTFTLANVSGQDNGKHSVEVFTTRPDTLFGATFLVVSPEKAKEWIDLGWKASDEVKAYVKSALKKKEEDRLKEVREKTGVDSMLKVLHPATGEEIPVWISDYVLGSYGTGAIMAVPAHDERDYEFAKKFNLPIKQVIAPHFTDSSNPPHEDKEWSPRQSVQVLVKHPKEEKILQLQWKKQPWKTFVVGGKEEGENYEEAARREIKEETGFKNIKNIQQLGFEVRTKFYAAHKEVNRDARTAIFWAELEDLEQDPISDGEQEIHDMEWVEISDIAHSFHPVSELPYILECLQQGDHAYEGEGILINSKDFDNVGSEEAREKITEKFGKESVTYRLRDWGVSRQRYWGVPIPIIHCEKCGVVPVPEGDLPVILPEITDYLPRDDGRSPLAKAKSWMEVQCSSCGGMAERETDTLDTFVDSSWYYLRYLDPHNEKEFSSRDLQKAWMPVDRYSGGAEHTTMHLLYSRFFYKALYDLGLVTEKEPYHERFNRGLILGPDGQKMSKSRGNVIDPDELVGRLGADSVRMYLAFIGPYNEVGTYPWDLGGIAGVRRFLERVYSLRERLSDEKKDSSTLPLLHKTIKKVEEEIESYKFNTAVSAMMEYLNVVMKEKEISREEFSLFIRILAPFAPYLAEELWHDIGHTSSVHLEEWPHYDESLTTEISATIAVQVNGKLRGSFEAAIGSQNEALETEARALVSVKKHLEGKEIVKVVVIPERLVNFVVR